jgi:KUP system potassium uptake protein
MEAAYGLAVSLTMIMSSILIGAFLFKNDKGFRLPTVPRVLIVGSFLVVETCFLVANLSKFAEGAWLSLLIGLGLIFIMYVWQRARFIKRVLLRYELTKNYLPLLEKLSKDEEVPKFATHLVYLTASPGSKQIESRIVHSIFSRSPKRADVYWFLHINVLDDPYTMNYEVEVLADQDVIWLTFNIGFRIEPRINLFFRKAVEDMVAKGEINIQSRYKSLKDNNMSGDFRFVLLESFISYDSKMNGHDRFVMNAYNYLHKLSLTDQAAYGLDTSNVTVEKVPLVVEPVKLKLERKSYVC